MIPSQLLPLRKAGTQAGSFLLTACSCLGEAVDYLTQTPFQEQCHQLILIARQRLALWAQHLGKVRSARVGCQGLTLSFAVRSQVRSHFPISQSPCPAPHLSGASNLGGSGGPRAGLLRGQPRPTAGAACNMTAVWLHRECGFLLHLFLFLEKGNYKLF